VSLSTVLNDRGSKERAFTLGCSPLLAASIGKTADMTAASLGFAPLVEAPLLVERERTVEAATIGTAFDYRARFDLGGFGPESSVARGGLTYLQTVLNGDAALGLLSLPGHERGWPSRDEHASHKYRVLQQGFERSIELLGGTPEDLDRAAILMAWCEQVFRAGTRALDGSLGERLVKMFDGAELAASIDSSWLRYLAAIRLAAEPQVDAWRAQITAHRESRGADSYPPGASNFQRPFYLPNPGFLGSSLVGGADGDWIIGDTLVDCKTDQAITTTGLREHLLQLIGYALLDLDDWYQIRKVAIWYPRFGLLKTWSLDTLLSASSDELLPRLRAEVRKSWGKQETLAVHQPIDQRRLGVMLAQNLNTPFEMLADLVATTADLLTLKHIGNNRSTPLEVLRDLANHPEAAVREQVAKNPSIPVDLLMPLLYDRRINVRRAAVSNTNLPLETLLGYAEETEYQAAAAANPNLPVERLLELAKASDGMQWDLRKAIANNPNATPDVLRALNYWDGEATLIRRRAEMTPELIAYIYAPGGPGDVAYLQDKLRQGWGYQAIGQRARLHVLGEKALDTGDAPRRARLEWLLTTGTSVAQLRALTMLEAGPLDDLVSGAEEARALPLGILPAHPALTAVNAQTRPDQLREMADHKDPAVRVGVALNPNTPDDALAVLSNDPDEMVRRVRAWNPADPTYLSRYRLEAEIAAVAGLTEYSQWELDTAMKSFRSELNRTWRAAIKAAVGKQPQISKLVAASAKADKELAELERKLSRTPFAQAAKLTAAANAKRTAVAVQRAALQASVLEATPGRRDKLERLQQRLEQVEALQSQRSEARDRHAGDRRFFFDEHPERLPQLEATSRSVDTDPRILVRLADLRLGHMSVYAALNERNQFDAPSEIIALCFRHSDNCKFGRRCDPALSRAVAAFRGSPQETLEGLAWSCGHTTVRDTAAAELLRRGVAPLPAPNREPSTAIELADISATDLLDIASSAGPSARATAAQHPELTLDMMIRMASDPRAEVRTALAKNPTAPTEILDFLGGEKSIQVRRAVAAHPHARPELLEQLAKENDFEIHWRLASNTGTPAPLLAQLATDPALVIAVSAMLNPSTPRTALEVVAVGEDTLLGALASALTLPTEQKAHDLPQLDAPS
jgi:hypothetical protein